MEKVVSQAAVKRSAQGRAPKGEARVCLEGGAPAAVGMSPRPLSAGCCVFGGGRARDKTDSALGCGVKPGSVEGKESGSSLGSGVLASRRPLVGCHVLGETCLRDGGNVPV